MGPVDPSVENPGKKFAQLYSVSFIFSCIIIIIIIIIIIMITIIISITLLPYICYSLWYSYITITHVVTRNTGSRKTWNFHV